MIEAIVALGQYDTICVYHNSDCTFVYGYNERYSASLKPPSYVFCTQAAGDQVMVTQTATISVLERLFKLFSCPVFDHKDWIQLRPTIQAGPLVTYLAWAAKVSAH